MEGFWLALEASAPAEWLKASFVAYPLVNALHIMSLGALVTSVVFLDIRTLGGFPSVAASPFVALMRKVALLCFAGAMLTGVTLFAVRASEYVVNPAFLAKIGLLALAGLNFLLLARAGWGRMEAVWTRLSAALSLALWPSIVLAGRFIGFLG